MTTLHIDIPTPFHISSHRKDKLIFSFLHARLKSWNIVFICRVSEEEFFFIFVIIITSWCFPLFKVSLILVALAENCCQVSTTDIQLLMRRRWKIILKSLLDCDFFSFFCVFHEKSVGSFHRVCLEGKLLIYAFISWRQRIKAWELIGKLERCRNSHRCRCFSVALRDIPIHTQYIPEQCKRSLILSRREVVITIINAVWGQQSLLIRHEESKGKCVRKETKKKWF